MKKKAIILSPERKRTVPRNAFQPGNKFAFVKGQSGNPGGEGRPRDPYRLVSKALRHRLNTRATDEAAIAAGLEPGASWAQVLGVSLINLAVAGDVAAARTVLEYTDAPLPRTARLELAGPDGEPLQPPALNIILVSSRTPQLDGPHPVAPRLPVGKRPGSKMLDAALAERAASAVVAAVKAGRPRSIATIDSCLPEGWVFDPTADMAGLQQATSTAHWDQLLRAGAVPRQ